MENIEVFENFWDEYINTFKKIWNRDLDDENIEKLIYETKDIFLKNTVQITGIKFTSNDLAKIEIIVEALFKS
jgi:hypothetical protein